jgi:hypothetical protein
VDSNPDSIGSADSDRTAKMTNKKLLFFKEMDFFLSGELEVSPGF